MKRTGKVKRVEVTERKLGGKVYGLAYTETGEIQIDPRHTSERERLDTVCHEILHILEPTWSEKDVKTAAKILSRGIWLEGYRRVLL